MSNWRRVRLAIEIMLIYIIAPVLVYFLVYVRHVPLLALLPFVLAILIVLLFLEPDKSWLKAFYRLPHLADLASIFGLFIVCGGALTYYASYSVPQYFLVFPERAPGLWRKVMFFYPLISVTTQEILYRVLYFHRYAPLFGKFEWGAILFNAFLFACMNANRKALNKIAPHSNLPNSGA